MSKKNQNSKNHSYKIILGCIFLIIVVILLFWYISTSKDSSNNSVTQVNTNRSNAPKGNFTINNSSKEAYDSFMAERIDAPQKWTINYAASRKFNDSSIESYTSTEYVFNESRRVDTFYSSSQTRSYLLNNTVVQCKKNNAWNCDALVIDSTEIPSRKSYWTDFSKASVAVDGTKEVLNITTQCYVVADATSGIVGRYCLYDGMIFYFKSTNGRHEKIATSYSLDVDESVFNLPK